MKTRSTALCLFVFLALLCAGCSDEAAQKKVMMRKACLEMLGNKYREFRSENGRSPKDTEELVSYIQQEATAGENVASETVKRLEEGEIVIFWNAALADSNSENEKYVLAYEAAVPRSGGYLVTGGGTIMLVTPGSFKDFKEYPQEVTQ